MGIAVGIDNIRVLVCARNYVRIDWLLSISLRIEHRCDSIQGTDYIANPFFVNLRVSKTKIENLRWQVGGDIIG